MMQQLARLKFTSFNLKVPTRTGRTRVAIRTAKHYGDAFKPAEKTTAPGVPPLVQPASLNKYHTDTQKMHIDKIGEFIDGICSAICSAWGTWQIGGDDRRRRDHAGRRRAAVRSSARRGRR